MNEEEEIKRTQEWLSAPQLSQGSTKEWWDSIEEIPMDINLRGVPKDALVAELKRREQEEREELKPRPLNKVDRELHPLLVVCMQYIDDLWNKGYVDEDLNHYIFEAAMEYIYGKEIFEKINLQHTRNARRNDATSTTFK